ncbi:hypothetical protein BH11ACT8_BH11ACT8_20130 [soil metagenome]
MTTPDRVRHADAIELLDRALAYTRGALLGVHARDLSRPTPCAGWDLDALLAHMDDALDAFTEAAGGRVAAPGVRSLAVRVETLQAKACALQGAWSTPGATEPVRLGSATMSPTRLALAAALEIAVHGWDVTRATGGRRALPDDLARRLMPVAADLVADVDRRRHFAPPLPARPGSGGAEDLLAFLGRDPVGTRSGARSAAPS